MAPRRGATLIELLVALAVLGTMAGLTGLPLRSAIAREPAEATDIVIQARRTAIETGRPVAVRYPAVDGTISMMALPDGSVLGGDRVNISRTSGRAADASR